MLKNMKAGINKKDIIALIEDAREELEETRLLFMKRAMAVIRAQGDL